MADKITPRAEDFSKWYQDIVLNARLADYSPVKGCMVIRPNGYSIWERIQAELDARIKEQGVRNAYFPLFIPESFLKKEAEHVEGFAPECAVVTYAGKKDLEERLIVRPTSETIINSMFSKWIQSYRDLPLLINQWANVVRWEMRTRLFLRTTEFLWQEGHTCHATFDEAEEMTRRMLRVYTQFSEDVLAMPVFFGMKTESEKFAGAYRTYCIEAMMQDKKALQAGTSHNLSQNFAKSFETKFLDQDGTEKLVYQTSWGVSTRLIGGLIMTHSDDRGLVLPPMVAQTHVVIIPIATKKPEQREKVLQACENLEKEIRAACESAGLPYKVGILIDRDETKQPGWKFFEYELLGMPLRIEIGPRDVDNGQAMLVRRDREGKTPVPLTEIPNRIPTELLDLQASLLARAREFRDSNTREVASYDELKTGLDQGGGFFIAGWSQDRAVEEKIKTETKATIRCILLDEEHEPMKTDLPCLINGKTDQNIKVIYARSY